MRVWTSHLFGSLALIAVLASCATAPPSPPPPVPPSSTDRAPTPPPRVDTPAANDTGTLARLRLCPLMTVQNAPPSQDMTISNYTGFVESNGIKLAVAPVGTGCLSSGFGQRSSRLHKGIDLHTSRPTPVFAGGDGIIKEAVYRDDYGNMVVIEHGNGVFTRYAHLQSFADGVAEGQTVSQGAEIGVMGNTASYRIPRHLHYEVLTGEWGPGGSFDLEASDPLSWPGYDVGAGPG